MAKMVRIYLFLYLRCVLCVPPSPTSALTDMLKTEFTAMKNTVKVLSDQWEKWNTLFLTSLEPRITSTASTLASIDSNIHNLQERAHVWDTFQLHVSAWNEQLASLDRKVDIISKGQEKVFNLDAKINAVLSMEYKLDNTIKILGDVHDSVSNLDTMVLSKKNHDALFNEFATRGVLSSIKLVEKKLDRLLIATQNNLLKFKGSDDKQKLTIKCNTPRIVEELLNDISSKVDIIFDNVSDIKDDDTDEYDYLDIEEGSGVNTDLKQQTKNQRLRKAIKKIIVPCKKTNHALEEILNRAVRIENTSLIILDKENTHFDKLSKDCKLKDDSNKYSVELTKTINLILESYFSEQRAHFESISNKLTKKCCASPSYNFATTRLDDIFQVTTASSTLFDNIEEAWTTTQNIHSSLGTWTPIIDQNRSSCEDLDNSVGTGVYVFSNKAKINASKLFFNKRYCEIRDDGLWTVIQRRDNYSIQHNFNASWNDYKYGFGDLHNDFWMGNEFLSTISNNSNLILRIELEDFENHHAWAEYQTFRVLPESDYYRLVIGEYTGNASDSFSSHNGSQFSTHDKKNDAAPECCPCAVSYGGGWWFNRCFESNLNGVYYRRPNDNNYFKGIIWEHWLGNYSLKKTKIMVKTKISKNSHVLKLSGASRMPYYEDP